MKKYLAVLLCLLLAFPLPTGATAEDSLFSDKDLTLATAENATPILLAGESVTIDTEGAYVLSGELANGSVRVSLKTEGTVWLLLNGVTVASDSGPALYTENCKKVIVTLAEGTVNTLSQSAGTDEGENAALYSRDDLTFNGEGTLIVNGAYADGVNCRDTLKVVGGRLLVTAADDGLVGKDAVIIGGGTVEISAGCDGIKATNEEDEAKGYVTLAGGTVTIVTGNAGTAANETAGAAESGGMASAYSLASANAAGSAAEAAGATTAVSLSDTAAGDAVSSATGQAPGTPGQGGGRPGGGHGGMGGDPGDRGGFGGMAEGNAAKPATSEKGIKAVTTLTLSGGTLNITATDDGLHAKDIVITDGQITLDAGDDGVHADNSLTISGGVMVISRAYEGLEATDIQITGGDITLTATDDGVNGAGGDAAQTVDSTGFGGFDRFSSSTGSLSISGGVLRVTAQGDGLDVNGGITMSGGQVYVNGPTNSANAALDYDDGFTMTGGTLIALGQAGMAQGVSAPAVAGTMASLNGGAGTFQVRDANGDVVLTMEAVNSFNSAVVYSDQLTDGGGYTLVTAGGEQTVTVSTEATGGGMGFGGRR